MPEHVPTTPPWPAVGGYDDTFPDITPLADRSDEAMLFRRPDALPTSMPVGGIITPV